MAPPQLLHDIWLVVSPIDTAPVGKGSPIVIVVGDGLVARPAAAW
jgi:hypothetical protein